MNTVWTHQVADVPADAFSMDSGEGSAEVAEELEELKDAGCLPEDFTVPEFFSACHDTDGGVAQKITCLANR